MTMTLGGVSSGSMSVSTLYSLNTARIGVQCYWFKLAAFNAGRRFITWNNGTSSIALVGTTEIEIIIDATTDAKWSSTDASLATGVWYCLVVCTHATSNTAYSAVAWLAAEGGERMRRLSLTNTQAGSGSVTNGTTTLTIGNSATGALICLDAEFGRMWFLTCTRGVGGPVYPESSGVLDDEAIRQVELIVVEPFFAGDSFPQRWKSPNITYCALCFDWDTVGELYDTTNSTAYVYLEARTGTAVNPGLRDTGYSEYSISSVTSKSRAPVERRGDIYAMPKRRR